MSEAKRSSAGSVKDIKSIEELLERIEEIADDHEEISVKDIVHAAGKRWFSSLLLIPGLIMLVPGVGDIPGVPIIMGLLVILASTQLILNKKGVWLPNWLENLSVKVSKVKKTVSWLKKPARFMDKISKPRLDWAVKHLSIYVIAFTAIVVSATTPIMELIPFSATLAGIAITSFGLALLARDGLIAIFAVIFSLGTLYLLTFQLI